MHLGARSPVLEPCVPNRSLSRPICGERRTKPNPSVHRRPSVVRQRRRDGCTAEGRHSESRGTVPIFSGSEKVQAWAMACVQLAWVLGGLVIPAGDWRAGGSPRLRLVFPLDQADALSHPHITEGVFSFDLDPLFPQILFSKRRRTLQDPPEGQGSSVTVSHPLPTQIWRSGRTLCATLSLHWTALWTWTSTAVQRYLAGDGPSLGRRR